MLLNHGAVTVQWEVSTGRQLRTFEIEQGTLTSLSFSADGLRVLTGTVNEDKSEMGVRIWDAVTGQALGYVPTLSGQPGRDAMPLERLSGASTLVSWTREAVRIFDTGTGQSLSSMTLPSGTVPEAVSADGSRAILAGGGLALVWDALAQREVQRFAYEPSRNTPTFAITGDGSKILIVQAHAMRLYDVASGRELRHWDPVLPEVDGASFSVQGDKVATRAGNRIQVWDSASGRLLADVEGSYPRAAAALISPDGQSVLGAGGQVGIQWDIASGKVVRRFVGHTSRVQSLAFSPDARQLMVRHFGNGAAQIWNLAESGGPRILRDIPASDRIYESSSFSPDGKKILLSSRTGPLAEKNGTVLLIDALSGRVEHQFPGEVSAFSPDGTRVLVADGKALSLYDLTRPGMPEFQHFEGHTRAINALAFSEGGDFVLSGSGDQTARLWEVTTGQQRQLFTGHASRVESVAFLPHTSRVVTSAFGGGAASVRIWDVVSGQAVHLIDKEPDFGVITVAVSPDGKNIVSGGKHPQLHDAEGGQALRRFLGIGTHVTAVAFSPDGNYLALGTRDGTVHLMEMATGKELAQLLDFDDRQWAVVDPLGRFDAPNGGQSAHLYWVAGEETIDLAQLKDRYFEPGLLPKLLGRSADKLVTAPESVSSLSTRDLFPSITVDPLKMTDTTLRIHVVNRGGGIGPVLVHVNGKEVSSDLRMHGDADQGAPQLDLALSRTQFAQYLNPTDGNQITVQAYNAPKSVLSRGTPLPVPVPQSSDGSGKHPTLWAVVVGISTYPRLTTEYQLHFSAKDADDFAHALTLAGGGGLFDHVNVTLLSTSQPPERQPSKAHLLDALKNLEKAAVGDVVVVYLAGHGDAKDKLYYYLTADSDGFPSTSDGAGPVANAVSSDELAQMLKVSPALKQVLVLDTCHAGAVMASLTGSRGAQADQVRALDRMKDRAGVYVLMGAAASQLSYESSQFQQGLLTYALLEFLSQRPLREGSFVDAAELLNFAADEVPELSRSTSAGPPQKPYIAMPQGAPVEGAATASFDIGELSTDTRKQIRLNHPRPLVLAPVFQDNANYYDDLKLGARLKAKLRESPEPNPGESPSSPSVVLLEAEELAGAISPVGRYTVNGTSISVSLRLRRNDSAPIPVTVDCKADALDDCTGKLRDAILAVAARPDMH